jgi:hypothetical protein
MRLYCSVFSLMFLTTIATYLLLLYTLSSFLTCRLLVAGFSIIDIADATFEADTTKRLRAETNKQQKWDGVHAMMELTGRNLRKLLRQNGGNSSTSTSTTSSNNSLTNKTSSVTAPRRRGSVPARKSSQTLVVSPSA